MTDFLLAGTHYHYSDAIKDLLPFLIDFVGNGLAATVEQVHVLESLSGLTDGAATSFETLNFFQEGSTRVFVEGLLLDVGMWTEALSRDSITILGSALPNNTRLVVEYIAEVML